MMLEAPDGLGLGIAGGGHVELDAVFFDHGDDFAVFLGANAVTQPDGAHRDRLPDALRPGGLAGMDRDIQAE